MEKEKILDSLDFNIARMQNWQFADAMRGLIGLRDELLNTATEAASKAEQPQQLKAKIRLLAESIESGERGIGSITKGAIAYRLRELSAV